jgi:Zn-dependent M28 family amino/carboxypeptidase
MSSSRRRAFAVIAASALAVSVAYAAPAYAAPGGNTNSVSKITKAVTLDGVMSHLEAFQDIADTYGDRAAGREGYAASVDYVVAELEAAGYSPVVQEFEFPYTEENSELIRISPNPRTFINEVDFLRPRWDTGVLEGTATGSLVPVDLVIPPGTLPNSNTSGCESADFAGFPAGGIALMQRGTCGFAVKALNAQAAGAAGVVIMNEGQPGRTGLLNMIGDATGLTIPAVFTTFAAGSDLASTPGATVTVTVDYEAETRVAWNVFAETATGNDANVVMAGAHLDSVAAGPGINDNGSGTAALVEVAENLAKVRPQNTLRFAWWGAEEANLVGSTFYVATLETTERQRIALYLNFDMIGSPNHGFFVYDGDDSDATGAGPGPAGSAQIEETFEAYFASRGIESRGTDFSGRSDYGPFIAVGIPSGGLFTGAEGIKTAEEALLWGGTAGVAYDPCYHQACDTYANNNDVALAENSDAVAYAVLSYAMSTTLVNGTKGKGNFRPLPAAATGEPAQ